ncbi:hypothetical protein BCV71DRAFT_189378 [Rhizopus microsporus]|uniref:P/Homo B domain-containing protein n=1 Tax=Rhizopus microsporus TaxID=58291 RepID=A0A1X0RMV5_RHIZD|nr:hypothetical protein BCV71DRAFT_189378 [Rhizopus microsporus]
MLKYTLVFLFFSSQVICTLYKRDFTSRNYYTLRTSSPKDIDHIQPILSDFNARFEGQVGELTSYYWISVPKESDHLISHLNTLVKRSIPDVDIRPQVPSKRVVKRALSLDKQEMHLRLQETKNALHIADPGFDKQWHLINTLELGRDLNVSGVWKQGITGKGSVVAILDDGLDFEHEDLQNNYYAEGSYDFNDHVLEPRPRLNDDVHGTRCAGEIAAAKNDVCGIGVAYDAKVAGIRILSGDITEADEAAALNYKYQENQIYSCSWGPPDLGEVVEGPQGIILDAIKNGIEHGRHGKGSIFVFASGNGGYHDDNCNFDGYTNSIYTVTVGAIDILGNHPPYAEKCAAQFLYTTDIHSGQCSDNHGGTSAAAPLAAGVFALVLSIRPDLSWRDLQHLCVQSAVPISLQDEDWQTLPSGRMFNHKYGYGMLDAYRIVELAKSFQSVGPQVHLEVSSANREALHIPDITAKPSRENALRTTLQVTREMAASLSRTEHVTVTVTIEHDRRGDLEILLVSPNNITSQLATPRKYDYSKDGLVNWTFMSVKHWDEDPVGIWSLLVIDERNPESRGRLVQWKLTIWGESKKEQRIATQSFLMQTFESMRVDKQRTLVHSVILASVALVIAGSAIFIKKYKLYHRKSYSQSSNGDVFELDNLLECPVVSEDEYDEE